MSKPSIIALYKIQDSIPSYNQLIENYNIIPYKLTTRENFINDMKIKPYSNAVAIYGSFPGFNPIGGLLDKQLIDSLPKNLKIIGISSAGYDNYNLIELSKRNIKLTNVPVSNEIAMDVADTALWHIISGFRKFNYWDYNSRILKNTLKIREFVKNDGNKVEDNETNFAFGHIIDGKPIRRISGKKAIILGYGLIGQFLVERLKVLNMNINIIVKNKEKYKSSKDYQKIFNIVEFDKIIENTDLIVICLPGGENTKHIIDENIINKLNPQSIIVNIGRGSCIDHNALKNAIQINHLSHVGLDVFDTEPLIEEFWTQNLQNCTITPHLGSSTFETFELATETNIKNIISVLQGKNCNNILN